jgi:EAL domain-containing protein (putative c-di-GMP-specific phosphodiesterase class I)
MGREKGFYRVVFELREPVKIFLNLAPSRLLSIKKINEKVFLIEFDGTVFAKLVRWIKRYRIDTLLESIYFGGLIFHSLEDFLEYFSYHLVKEVISPFSYRYQKIFDYSGNWIAFEVLFNFPRGLSAFDIKTFGIPTADIDLLIIGKLFEFYPELLSLDKKVFVNVFPSSLTDAVFKENFLSLVGGASNVTVEVLEYKIFDRSEFLRTLETFRERRIAVAVDDWGSENAGISRVVSMRPNYLKIDKSITWNRLGRKLVKPFIRTLKRELGVKVIVEGIDNNNHLNWAKSVGAYVQGYFLHKPEGLHLLLR